MRTVFVAMLTLALLAVPVSALAAFSRGTTPVALSVGTGTLGAPHGVTVPSTSTGSVAVSWTAPSGAPTGTRYYVTRTTGTTTTAACGTSSSSTISATSCTDTVSTSGTYTYKVIAVFKLWTKTSSASSSVVVTVTPPGQLGFNQNPQSAKSDDTLGIVIVQLKNSSGVNVSTSGVAVTLSLSDNTTSGTLSGTLTQTTGSNGTATFSGLSVDKVGTYTLTASASAFTSVASSSFTISAGSASQVSVYSGSGQSATRGSTFSKPVVVLVTDAEDNPVSNASVLFIAPGSGASGTFSNNNTSLNAVSDSSGLASVTVKANSIAGTWTLTAWLGSASDTATLTNR
jgi:hypothetical protein